MSKRNGFVDDQRTKKAKIDDFNDLWGDDFDGDLIENCFERATQICEEEHNANFLKSYSSVFKESKVMLTSTQFTQQCPTSYSESSEQKLNQLQKKYTEKEGEVVILRANLQSLRSTCQAEQERKEKEWKDKLYSTQKESKAIKSELEFKNLEIANLKQQILELSKHIKNEKNLTQRPKVAESTIISPQKSVQNPYNTPMLIHTKIQINSKTFYPLQRVNFLSIFQSSPEENCIIRTKSNLYKTTHNHVSEQTDFLVNFEKKNVTINEKELDLDYVYSDIIFLTNLSSEDLGTEKSLPFLNKIICVSWQLLTNFYDYLRQVEAHIQFQDVQEADSNYLQENNSKKHGNGEDCGYLNEVGVKCGKLLGFLAEVVPFSPYFKSFLLQETTLNLDSGLDYVKVLPCLTIKSNTENTYLLLILNIITSVGRTRKEQICSEFLSAVVKLLCKIFTCDKGNNQMSQKVYHIAKEVLFLRLQVSVTYQITFLMKIASMDSNFTDCLCSKPNVKKMNNSAKGVLYFDRESCRFHMFVILLENALPKIKSERHFFCASLNVLSFIYNVFQFNNVWLYQLEDKRCNCLCQLYKLGIDIIYRNMKSYQELSSRDVQPYKTIFRNGIKILHLLTSNSYDLIQKYVTDLARFKEIIYLLIQLHVELGLNEEELRSLEKLSVVEDLPEIPSHKFTEVDF